MPTSQQAVKAYLAASGRSSRASSKANGPQPFVPGAQSPGAFAVKMASAILDARTNKAQQARDDEMARSVMAEHDLNLQVLQNKLATSAPGYVSPEGKALIEWREAQKAKDERPVAPTGVHAYPEGTAKAAGLPGAGEYPDATVRAGLTVRGQDKSASRSKDTVTALATRRALIDQQVKREASAGYNKQAGEINRYASIVGSLGPGWTQAAAKLGINPQLRGQYEKPDLGGNVVFDNAGWQKAVSQAVTKVHDEVFAGHLQHAQFQHKADYDKLDAFSQGVSVGAAGATPEAAPAESAPTSEAPQGYNPPQ